MLKWFLLGEIEKLIRVGLDFTSRIWEDNNSERNKDSYSI